MKYIINNLRLALGEDVQTLRRAAARKLGITQEDITGFRITRESVDARHKSNISLVYSVAVETGKALKAVRDGDVRLLEDVAEERLSPGSVKLNNRPIVIGTGPAGMFAGLVLAQYGYRPLLLERGDSVSGRTLAVRRFWESGELDPETNVQFGEGGAGTFSDGKLTTRINDGRCGRVLEEFFKSGAHAEILYKARPHIGSDVLATVVANMRNRIISLGGEVRFKTKVVGFRIRDGRIRGLAVSEGAGAGGGRAELEADVVVLAAGHSARDTYAELLAAGVGFVPKPFSIGVRIEHPQQLINEAQYGRFAGHPALGAADYQLFYRDGSRTTYSFCMCPGGLVVASASEPGTVVTNGMSEFARNRENANSALVVSVEPGDFGSGHPLSGVEFQRTWERLAFEAGGRNYAAPVQRLGDFIEGRASKGFGAVQPGYTGKVRLSDINMCLPQFVTDSIKGSIAYFDSKLRGFGIKDALLTGVETRTSSPVRIPRTGTLEAEGVRGLYPAGEGAGYAGGIVSAAVDGIRVAERIIGTYRFE